MQNVQQGMRVRQISTNLVGIVEEVYHDNSCSDPGCCGGHFPSTAGVRWDCGHYQEFEDDCKGRWEDLEEVTDSPPENPPLENPTVGQYVMETPRVAYGVEDLDAEYVYVRHTCGCKTYHDLHDNRVYTLTSGQ